MTNLRHFLRHVVRHSLARSVHSLVAAVGSGRDLDRPRHDVLELEDEVNLHCRQPWPSLGQSASGARSSPFFHLRSATVSPYGFSILSMSKMAIAGEKGRFEHVLVSSRAHATW